MDQQNNQQYFLLFINSISGGRKGAQYLTVGENRVKFKSKQGFYAYVYLYDMFSQTQRQKGFKNALELTKTNNNVNIIICGGDGTVLWVVSSIINAGVDPEKVCFGIIPIGTGNDFSRSLGWGGSPINFNQNDVKQLRKSIQKWLNASKQTFDLWDVQISTFQGGKIVSSSSSVSQSNTASLSKTFSNYLGIGIDARVSYYFQKNRTESKLINLTLYGCIGFLCCFRKTQKIDEAVTEFSQSQSESELDNSDSYQPDNIDTPHIKKRILLLQKKVASELSQIKIKKGYTGLVCLNSTSYMSGVKNIFNTNKIAAKNKKMDDFTDQSFNDGKLEFVGFKNQLALGLERFIHTAGRITQGQGPFCIKFTDKKESQETFVQIDGESMIAHRLKQIKIMKSKLANTGQIRVLVKNKK